MRLCYELKYVGEVDEDTQNPEKQAGRSVKAAMPPPPRIMPSDHATIWRWKETNGTLRSVIVGTKNTGDFISTLARFTNSRAVEIDWPGPPDGADHIFTCTPRWKTAKGSLNAAVASTPIYAMVNALSAVLPENAWVAMTVRHPRERVTEAMQSWIADKMDDRNIRQTHWAEDPNDILLADIFLGLPHGTSPDVIMRTAYGQLPLADWGLRVVKLNDIRPALWGVGLGGVLAVPGFTEAAGLLGPVADYNPIGPHISMAASGLGGTAAILSAAGNGALWSQRWWRGERTGILPPVHARDIDAWQRLKRTFSSSGKSTGKGESAERERENNDARAQSRRYPVPGSIVVNGLQVGAWAVPHNRTTSEQAGTITDVATYPAPAEASFPGGLFVGVDPTDRRIDLIPDRLTRGISIFGDPGMGKSQLMELMIFGLSRIRSQGVNGQRWPANGKMAMVVFNYKGAATPWHKVTDCYDREVIKIEATDPSTMWLDLYNSFGGDHFARGQQLASVFSEAINAAGGQGSAMYASRDLFRALFPLAALVTPEMCAEAIVPFRGMWGSAYVLAGGSGASGQTSDAARLWQVLVKEANAAEARIVNTSAAGEPQTNLGKAVRGWQRYQEGSAAKQADQNKAILNKIALIERVDALVDPSRPMISWREILQGRRVVVVNLGTAPDGTQPSEDLKELLSVLMMTSLKAAIGEVCVDWESSGEGRVVVASDEISLAAGDDDGIVRWFPDQGRSAGVIPIFATQRVDVISPQMRSAMESLGVVLRLKTKSVKLADEAVVELQNKGPTWRSADISNLDPFKGVLVYPLMNDRQVSFSLSVPRMFRAKLADLNADYDSPTIAAAHPDWFADEVLA